MRCNRLKSAIRELLAFARNLARVAGNRRLADRPGDRGGLQYARQVVDPYGVYPDLPDGYDCIGRCYFARTTGSRVWIEFGDPPEATREALWMRARDRHLPDDDEVLF